MRSILCLLLLAVHSCLVHALHKSDVGVVDWYKQLVGVPLVGNIVTAPTFLRSQGKQVILTATTSNVLAALDPEDGHVVWRFIYEPADRIAGYYTHGDVVASLSGPGGATLRTFNTHTGALLLEKQLHPPALGHIAEPHFFGKHVVFGGENTTDIFTLTNGYLFSRLDGKTGETKWSFEMPDASSMVITSKLILTPSALYLVGIAKSTASFTIHVTTLDPETGEFITLSNIPSSLADPIGAFLPISLPNSEHHRLVWLEEGALKHVALEPTLKAKPVAVKNAEFSQLIDVGLAAHGQVVAIKKDGTARIVKLTENGIKSVYEFADSAYSDERPQSLYAGSVDENGKSYISRVYWSHDIKKMVAEIYSGTSELSVNSFDFDTANHGIIAYIGLNVNAIQKGFAHQMILATFTGSVQLIAQNGVQWNRDEALTATIISGFVELPPPKAVVSDHDGEGFTARLIRQIGDLQNLPAYIINFVQRFSTGTSISVATKGSLTGEPTRDEFGFRQIIVVATMFGKVYGLDSATGEVVWTRLLGLGWAAQVGGRVVPVKLFVLNGEGVGDKGKGSRSDVVLVAQRRADNKMVDTVVFHIDAVTGDDATGASPRDDVLEGVSAVEGAIVESYLLEHQDQKVVIFLDEYLRVHTYPDTSAALDIVAKVAPSLYLSLRTSVDVKSALNGESIKKHRLIGQQIVKNGEEERFVTHPVWSLSFAENEDIVGVVSPINGPIASYGKVLANRSTLYKYLNPHMSVVLTNQRGSGVSRSAVAGETQTDVKEVKASCGIYVVDGVKGSVLYHATLPAPGVGVKCDVKAVLTENWLVYHYYDPEEAAVEEARGWKMVSVEMYEGEVDERTRSSDTSSYSNSSAQVKIFEDAFVFGQGITTITTTKTKFGISTKDIIVATKSNTIQSYPRRILDPRRPRHKPTNQELEEGLIQYDPVLPNNPKFALSHEYNVANTQNIITTPSLLESTSLVFTSGLDMFLTRTSPSGTFDLLSETFNKQQLVLTVVALAVAIGVIRPIVREKRLNAKWFF